MKKEPSLEVLYVHVLIQLTNFLMILFRAWWALEVCWTKWLNLIFLIGLDELCWLIAFVILLRLVPKLVR